MMKYDPRIFIVHLKKLIILMTKELSGLTVVIIVAGGILTLILLFIFVKRQIVRFALRSRRGPHVPVGHDAKKSFRREIDRRIECIPKILYEPKILDTNDPKYILPPSENCIYLSSLYYRSRAVDDVKKLGNTYKLIYKGNLHISILIVFIKK
ncbi:hypothetical protein PGB90_003957 [Kerria lacca]